jgi:hypothetical protein
MAKKPAPPSTRGTLPSSDLISEIIKAIKKPK